MPSHPRHMPKCVAVMLDSESPPGSLGIVVEARPCPANAKAKAKIKANARRPGVK
jgi:hypothetical protein